MELVCPAGSLPALRAAVDNGANSVYMGFRNATNARNFEGLNFDERSARRGLAHAHAAGSRVFAAINTYAAARHWTKWTDAVDQAVDLGVDALILADPGLISYAANRYPDVRLHLSVQASATTAEAIEFHRRRFRVRRAVLPRVLSLAQVRRVIAGTDAEIEVFGFGSLCVMVEGRCALSSYVTGEAPNTCGVCSPAKAVRWTETVRGRESRLNDVLVDVYSSIEPAGYPTLCKGRFDVGGQTYYALEEPTSLSVLDILPALQAAGVKAVKVEGRQRSPAYVAEVTRIMREALDQASADPENYASDPALEARLDRLAEGRTHTLGALQRRWQ